MVLANLMKHGFTDYKIFGLFTLHSVHYLLFRNYRFRFKDTEEIFYMFEYTAITQNTSLISEIGILIDTIFLIGIQCSYTNLDTRCH